MIEIFSKNSLWFFCYHEIQFNQDGTFGSYVVTTPAPPKPAGRPGRQAFYGEKVHLKECFDYPDLFEAVSCQVYGKTESIQVMSLTLLWRPIADYVLFVLAVTSKGPIILMSSDLELLAVNAIELYCARTRIEILFSVLKHVIGAFNFRFWTKSLPKHSRRPFPNRDLKAPQPHQIGTIQACWKPMKPSCCVRQSQRGCCNSSRSIFKIRFGLNIGYIFAPNRAICRQKKLLNKLSLNCSLCNSFDLGKMASFNKSASI